MKVSTLELMQRADLIPDNEDREYREPMLCRYCAAHLGWAPYSRDDYLCISCDNDGHNNEKLDD